VEIGQGGGILRWVQTRGDTFDDCAFGNNEVGVLMECSEPIVCISTRDCGHISTVRAARRHGFMEALETQSLQLETQVGAFTFGSSVVFKMPVRLNKLFFLTH
jgi:hypothetical protein